MIYGKKRNKYNVADAEDRTYGVDKHGEPVVFHSAAEAERAQELDLLLRGKVITGYERQVEFQLGEDTIYVADFVVHGFDLSNATATWVEEIKGFETREFKRVRRLWKKYGPCTMIIYTRKGNGWVTERIVPLCCLQRPATEGAQNAE